MRIHPREQSTNAAESELAQAMHRALLAHPDLTEGEWLRVVHGAYHTIIGGLIKSSIRDERHGDLDKPGGLE